MPDTLLKQTTFRRLLLRAIGLPFLIMLALASVLVWQINSLLHASHWIEHTDQALAQAHEALNLFSEMESGRYGYLSAGEPRALAAYERAANTFPPALSSLQNLTADNPDQRAALNSIQANYRTWAESASNAIRRRKAGQGGSSNPDAFGDKSLRDALRKQFQTFIQTEERLRTQRSSQARLGARLTLIGASVAALSLGVTLAALNRRWLFALSHAYEDALTLSRKQHAQLQRQAEELTQQTAALQASEAHLTTTLRSIGDAVIATDTTGNVTFLNPVATRLTGWTPEEATGKPLPEVFTIVNEETRQTVESPVEKVLREGMVVGLANHTIVIAQDGTETPIDDTAAPIRNEQGALSGVVLVFHDISERKRAEEERREQANRFRLLFANNPHPMWVYDLETLQFLEVNAAAVQQYGYSREEFLQQHITDIRPNEEVERLLTDVQTPRPKLQRSGEWRHRRKNGEVFYVEITSHEIEFAGRRGALVVAQDMTEKRRLENQLLQAQKLESVGRLAGGVAHDFNNLLTAILGYTELAEEECDLDADGREYLANVKTAATKAADLTQQLLAFARRQVIEPRIVNLNDLILDLDKMMRRLIAENIELVILPEERLHCVKIDPGQFEQILINLAVNARDAMPNGGKITIETANVTLDEEYAQHHEGVAPGDYVLLAVSDTGVGMEEGVRLHIFEPFFTTKEKGRGTGLGLATVYGIVRQAGGHIWLYSEVGEGTTFKIYLPRTEESAETTSSLAPAPPQPGGSETILLVEDEPAVRNLAALTLRSRGYTVWEAANGEEGLRVAKGREQEIALLITDVVMPQMSGKELAERMQALHPGLSVLYASGYTENTIVHHGVLEPGIAFLSKPFTPSALAQRVREILDSASST